MYSGIFCLNLGMLVVLTLYTWPSGSKFWYKNINWARRPIGPDFLENEFSLWGYLDALVYDTYPANIPDFKQQVCQHIEAIPNDLLQCVVASVLGQMHECRDGDGGHLKNVILVCWWLHLIVHWVKNVCKLHFFSTLVISLENNQPFHIHPLETIRHHCVHCLEIT